MKERHKQLLQHMLGADDRYKKKQWGFRNHFCAGEGHTDLPDLFEMENLGLVKSGSTMGGLTFWATKKGALEIGFKPYQLKHVRLASS